MLTKGVIIEKLKLCAASIGLLAWGQEDELQGWGIVFSGGLWLMLVIELVSKWEICWAFVELSFVWSGLTTRPDPNNIVWFFNGRFTKA